MINKKLLSFDRKALRYVGLNVLFQWLGMLCNVVLVMTVSRLIGGVFAGSLTGNALWQGMLLCLLTVPVRYGLTLCASDMSDRASKDVKRTLRSSIYAKLARLGPNYTETAATSEVVMLASEGVEQIDTYFAKYLPQLFYSLLAPVILFALLVKLVCIPLTIKSKKSMLAMSAMNAELQQLQKKYANNRVKLNEEMQKLYEKHGVSPMSGCLPNLIPLPIMMGLYYAVQQPLQYIVGLSRETVIALAQMIGLDQLAGANYTVQILIAEKLNAFVDAAGNFSSDVMNCLQSGETIFPLDFHFFGLNLADTPSISHPSIIWIIPILSGLTAFLSSYIMQKMQGTQNSAAAGQMKMLNFMMPLMSLYFAFILPGAIGIYWIFNNVFTCVQEIILTKTLRGKQEAKQAAEAARIEAEKQAKREAHKAAQKQQSQNAKNKKGDK